MVSLFLVVPVGVMVVVVVVVVLVFVVVTENSWSYFKNVCLYNLFLEGQKFSNLRQ